MKFVATSWTVTAPLWLWLQVQAHVAQTEVDPGAAVAWLRVTDQGLQASPVSTQLMR